VGKGRAVCLNVLLTWPSGLQIPVTEQRETFRQAIDQLVRRLGVEPDFELQNTRGYGEGIVDFVTAQFDLPGSDVRVLSMFSDWRSRRSDARLRLRAGYTQAWDVMAGRRLVSITDPTGVPEAVVTVQPGQWRLLALLKAEPPAPALSLPAEAQQGAVVPLRLAAGAGRTLYGRLDVWGPDGSPLGHHCRSVVAPAGDAPALRLRLDDPPGEWRVRYTDAISGAHAEKRLRVAPAADARALAKAPAYPDAPLTGERLAARGPEITNAEFIGLLERLRACHLDPGPVDKRRYSYYTCESYDSRQRFCQLLAGTDWMERAEALRDYLARGERLYLVGEDMGYEPESGVATTPARAPRILDALQSLADRGELLQVSGKPHLRLLKVGKGMMVLDRRSPDAAGNSNLHLAAFHQSWLDEMKELDLLPGGKGPLTLPVGKQTVQQWLLGR
jgi:hypothetical protein